MNPFLLIDKLINFFGTIVFPILGSTGFFALFISGQCSTPLVKSLWIIFALSVICSLGWYFFSKRPWYFLPKRIQVLKTALAVTAICGFAFSVIGAVWRFSELPQNGKTRILLAPFRDGTDTGDVTNSLMKGLQETQIGSISPKQLKHSIAESDGRNAAKECLKECNGDVIVWGSYSDYTDGTAQIYTDFKSKCPRKWSENPFFEKEIPLNKEFRLKAKQYMSELTLYVTVISSVAVDEETCRFKSMPMEAQKPLEQLFEKAKTNADIRDLGRVMSVFLANYSYNAKDYSAAIKWLEEGEKLFPLDLEFKNLLAITQRQAGNRTKALEWVTAGLKLAPDNAGLLNGKGILEREIGEPQKALASYSQAIENINAETSNEEKATIFSNRGSLNESLGKYAEAISDYDISLKALERPKTRKLRAQSALAIGNMSIASEDLGVLVSLGFGDEPGVLYLRSRLELQKGSQSTFFQLLSKLIVKHQTQLNRDQLAEAYYTRALGYVKFNKLSEAESDLNQSLRILRKSESLFLLCQIRETTGSLETALELCREARSVPTSNPNIEKTIKRIENRLNNKK